MSWESYVENLEKGKGKCQFAAIYGKQGGCWAESKDKSALNPSEAEISVAAKAVISNDMNIMGSGVSMGGHKFTCLRMEPELLICQGKAEAKEESLVIATSNTAVLVGFNPSAEVKTTQVRDAVEVMKNYLKDCGY